MFGGLPDATDADLVIIHHSQRSEQCLRRNQVEYPFEDWMNDLVNLRMNPETNNAEICTRRELAYVTKVSVIRQYKTPLPNSCSQDLGIRSML